MLENVSPPNNSRLNRHISPINSSLPSYIYCFIAEPGSINYITLFTITITVISPLCIFILYHGVREWQKRRSTSSAAPISHCDCFTYHMVIMELIAVSGCLICCCGIYRKDSNMINVAFFPFNLNYYGQALFHVLTCVERYLAVMHPITYLSLRQERGVRIRNIIIGCVWLLCSGLMGLMLYDEGSSIISFCIMASTLAVISFCSFSVLCALIRPGPGEQGGNRKRVDQSKRRAFSTIVVILAALVLRFAGSLVWAGNYTSGGHNDCVLMALDFWFYIPSSLVLPLLLLHRAGKLKCCKKSIKRGEE